MPELPDVTLYVEALTPRIVGETLERVSVTNPFVLRTFDPPLRSVDGLKVLDVSRIGKRIVLGLQHELFLVIHLMIAGRLRWRERDPVREKRKVPKIGAKITLATFEFPSGTLYLTEAGSKRRASLHVVRGQDALNAMDRGGIDVLSATIDEFAAKLRVENHTLKRSLTDPRLFSGIGNAYSDEILHRAKLSPTAHSARLDDEQIRRLYDATRETLLEWIDRLRKDADGEFPEKVTAFREEMAVHGKFGLPCPVCGTPVQRIRYADNETNYCARCQTGGRLLADRGLSRLLKQDWPRSIDELAD